MSCKNKHFWQLEQIVSPTNISNCQWPDHHALCFFLLPPMKRSLVCLKNFVFSIGCFVSRHNIEKFQRFSRAGPRGSGREWATLGVHPLSWLLSNNRLEKVPVVSVPHTSSNRLLLSNQDKGCTPSVAHSLPLPLGPALLNLSIV